MKEKPKQRTFARTYAAACALALMGVVSCTNSQPSAGGEQQTEQTGAPTEQTAPTTSTGEATSHKDNNCTLTEKDYRRAASQAYEIAGKMPQELWGKGFTPNKLKTDNNTKYWNVFYTEISEEDNEGLDEYRHLILLPKCDGTTLAIFITTSCADYCRQGEQKAFIYNANDNSLTPTEIPLNIDYRDFNDDLQTPMASVEEMAYVFPNGPSGNLGEGYYVYIGQENGDALTTRIDGDNWEPLMYLPTVYQRWDGNGFVIYDKKSHLANNGIGNIALNERMPDRIKGYRIEDIPSNADWYTSQMVYDKDGNKICQANIDRGGNVLEILVFSPRFIWNELYVGESYSHWYEEWNKANDAWIKQENVMARKMGDWVYIEGLLPNNGNSAIILHKDDLRRPLQCEEGEADRYFSVRNDATIKGFLMNNSEG